MQKKSILLVYCSISVHLTQKSQVSGPSVQRPGKLRRKILRNYSIIIASPNEKNLYFSRTASS